MNKKLGNIKYIIIIVGIILIVLSLIFLLPKMMNKEYYLVLNGDTDIVIKQNTPYIEAGFNAKDNKENNLQNQVIIEGEINTNIVGEYKLTYRLNNIIRERTILVVSEENQVTYLILSGESTMFLKVGEKYQEPGFTVIDNLETDLNNKVKITGNINTNVSGTYKIKYSVTNKSGKIIEEERTVIVMDSRIKVNYTPTQITDSDVAINISINDNYFDYILLPDKSKSFNRTTVYKVSENGTYKFMIYSKDGSNKEQEIIINNIDKIPPSGSCSGYYKKGKTYISISAKDNLGISKYVIDNQIFTSNQITLNKELVLVNVNVYDKANNLGTIKINSSEKVDKVVSPESAIRLVNKTLSGFYKFTFESVLPLYALYPDYDPKTQFESGPGQVIKGRPVYAFLIKGEEDNSEMGIHKTNSYRNFVVVDMITGDLTTDLDL